MAFFFVFVCAAIRERVECDTPEEDRRDEQHTVNDATSVAGQPVSGSLRDEHHDGNISSQSGQLRPPSKFVAAPRRPGIAHRPEPKIIRHAFRAQGYFTRIWL